MVKAEKLVILGDSAFAEIAYEYFTHESNFAVVGFSVEAAYQKKDSLLGLPIVAFERLESHFHPGDHHFFAAVTYTQLNRLRARLYASAKQKGYRAASFISQRAVLWRNVKLGEHCFIFENNVVQPFVEIGNNVVLWSGNHVGHHSRIGDNVFVASHAVVSGFCDIGDNCFVGVNATISNNVRIGRDALIGAGAVVANDIEEDKVVRAQRSEASGSARRLSRVPT
jgi:sugar O-acyltransferase (sialic acid O-acetyltransferase NeuD family)